MASTLPSLDGGRIQDYTLLTASIYTSTSKFHGSFNLALEFWATKIAHPHNRAIDNEISAEVSRQLGRVL